MSVDNRLPLFEYDISRNVVTFFREVKITTKDSKTIVEPVESPEDDIIVENVNTTKPQNFTIKTPVHEFGTATWGTNPGIAFDWKSVNTPKSSFNTADWKPATIPKTPFNTAEKKAISYRMMSEQNAKRRGLQRPIKYTPSKFVQQLSQHNSDESDDCTDMPPLVGDSYIGNLMQPTKN